MDLLCINIFIKNSIYGKPNKDYILDSIKSYIDKLKKLDLKPKPIQNNEYYNTTLENTFTLYCSFATQDIFDEIFKNFPPLSSVRIYTAEPELLSITALYSIDKCSDYIERFEFSISETRQCDIFYLKNVKFKKLKYIMLHSIPIDNLLITGSYKRHITIEVVEDRNRVLKMDNIASLTILNNSSKLVVDGTLENLEYLNIKCNKSNYRVFSDIMDGAINLKKLEMFICDSCIQYEHLFNNNKKLEELNITSYLYPKLKDKSKKLNRIIPNLKVLNLYGFKTNVYNKNK